MDKRYVAVIVSLGAVLALALVVSARGSGAPYTKQDLDQVTTTFYAMVPVYRSFATAFLTHNDPVMEQDFREEQRYCKVVDAIDQRDTIDPNTNLFAVSAGLDNFCNGIEEYYAAWRKSQHLPYDHSVQPGDTSHAFVGTEDYITLLSKQIKHPSQLT
jgi:hypothetical protein